MQGRMRMRVEIKSIVKIARWPLSQLPFDLFIYVLLSLHKLQLTHMAIWQDVRDHWRIIFFKWRMRNSLVSHVTLFKYRSGKQESEHYVFPFWRSTITFSYPCWLCPLSQFDFRVLWAISLDYLRAFLLHYRAVLDRSEIPRSGPTPWVRSIEFILSLKTIKILRFLFFPLSNGRQYSASYRLAHSTKRPYLERFICSCYLSRVDKMLPPWIIFGTVKVTLLLRYQLNVNSPIPLSALQQRSGW